MRSTFNFIVDWCLFSLVIAVIVAVLIGQATISYGSDGEYWKAKVASAIAIKRSLNGVSESLIPDSPVVKSRPKVYIAFAPFYCPPCEIQKSAIQGWNPEEFDIEVVSSGQFPVQISSYPCTAWKNSSGEWVRLPQWTGRAALIATWNLSQQPKSASTRPQSAVRSQNAYNPQWTWPGNLKQHLQSTHGVPNASNLTQDEAERLHDSLHNNGGSSGKRKRRG